MTSDRVRGPGSNKCGECATTRPRFISAHWAKCLHHGISRGASIQIKRKTFLSDFCLITGGKTMKKLLLIGLVAGGLSFAAVPRSDAQVYFSIGFGPGYYGYYSYRYYRPYYGYYRPFYLLRGGPLVPHHPPPHIII